MDSAKTKWKATNAGGQTQAQNFVSDEVKRLLCAEKLDVNFRFSVKEIYKYAEVTHNGVTVPCVKAAFWPTYENCVMLCTDHCLWREVYDCRLKEATRMIAAGSPGRRALEEVRWKAEQYGKEYDSVWCHCCAERRARLRRKRLLPDACPTPTENDTTD